MIKTLVLLKTSVFCIKYFMNNSKSVIKFVQKNCKKGAPN